MELQSSGKLPMSFQVQRGAIAFVLYKNTGRPIMNEPESVFWSHYIDENTRLNSLSDMV
jgi:beta-glucosidase